MNKSQQIQFIRRLAAQGGLRLTDPECLEAIEVVKKLVAAGQPKSSETVYTAIKIIALKREFNG